MKAFPTDQQVENVHREGQTSLNIDSNAMHDFLERENRGEHGKHGFDKHPFIMDERLTRLQIGWISVFVMKAMIGEDHRVVFAAVDERLKGGVMHIGRITPRRSLFD